MNPRSRAKLDEILSDLLDVPAASRGALADTLCDGDAELRSELQQMLDLLPDAEAYFGGIEEFTSGTEDSLAGRRVGAYRILSRIGSGGMGSVYRAERADGEFQGEVAMKFVSPLFAGPAHRRRFQMEKQALSGLRHANVAQLLDAGISEDGLPYLVMELVDGIPIDRYCDAEGLDIAARIRLFLGVCDAVQYAHQNLIVHRDIKPANVLVTREGQPKLLDFGIAKMLGNAATQVTLPQDRMMTLAYSSPEQVRGEAVSTSSDTYSLGLLLYELLAGSGVIQSAGANLTEVVRRVCEWDPPPPSQAARTQRARKELRGDLDNIILKAIRKEPEQRYASARELGDDLRNYLERRPVAARAAAPMYRMGKFVRRNRIAVLVGALAGAALLAATVSVWVQSQIAERERRAAVAAKQVAEQHRTEAEASQAVAVAQKQAAEEQRQIAEQSRATEEMQRRLAEERFQEVRQLASLVMFQYQAQLAASGGETALRARMAQDSIAYLDRLAAHKDSDRELQLEIARGYIQVGMLLGVPNRPNLGDRDGARKSLEKARVIAARLLREDPTSTAAGIALADTTCLAIIFDPRMSAECVSRWETLMRANPARDRMLSGLADAYTSAANGMDASDRRTIDYRTRALDLYQKYLESHPNHMETYRNMALNHKSLAGSYSALSDQRQMLVHINRAIEIDERRLKQFPEAPGVWLDLSFDFSMLGTYYEQANDFENALAQFKRVLDLRKRSLDRDPSNEWLQGRVSYAFQSVGRILMSLLRFAEAAASFKAGLGLAGTLAARPRDGEWNRVMWWLNAGYADAVEADGHRGEGLCGVYSTALRHFQAAGSLVGNEQPRFDRVREKAAACPPVP